MRFKHSSMSIAQHWWPIYNTTVNKKRSNVALNVYVRAIRHQQATRADKWRMLIHLKIPEITNAEEGKKEGMGEYK